MKYRHYLAAAACFLSAAMGAAMPAAAQEAVQWRQAPIIFLPGEVEAGQGDFIEGQTIVRFPLRWALSTRLAEDVVISVEGEEIVLEKGELLPRVIILQDGNLQFESQIYCTRSRTAESREGSGFLGLLGGPLFNSLRDGQTCLQDVDKDGTFDRAIALGETDSILDLGQVSKVAYEELLAEPIDPERDYAEITLASVGRSQIQLGFFVYQRGSRRVFDRMQSGGFYARDFNPFRYGEGEANMLPLLGMRFDLGDADRKENRASFTWFTQVGLDTFIVIPDNVTPRYGY